MTAHLEPKAVHTLPLRLPTVLSDTWIGQKPKCTSDMVHSLQRDAFAVTGPSTAKPFQGPMGAGGDCAMLQRLNKAIGK